MHKSSLSEPARRAAYGINHLSDFAETSPAALRRSQYGLRVQMIGNATLLEKNRNRILAHRAAQKLHDGTQAI